MSAHSLDDIEVYQACIEASGECKGNKDGKERCLGKALQDERDANGCIGERGKNMAAHVAGGATLRERNEKCQINVWVCERCWFVLRSCLWAVGLGRRMSLNW